MEIHSGRVWFLSILIGLILIAYLISLPPVAADLHLEFAENAEPSSTLMAAGYAGMGEGWGMQAVRRLVGFSDIAGVCALELPVLLNNAPVQAAPVPVPESVPATVPATANGKTVLIYCTHTTESYIADEGAPRTEGRPGLILEVARTLGAELEEQGYAVTVSEDLYDWPSFTASYSQSRRAVQDFLKLHPDAAAIIDVHRDSFPDGGAITGTVEGKTIAPVLLVVGTDKRQPHPNWADNLAFANQLDAAAQEMYPGLIRGVRPKAGVYNQDLSTRAMLIEFGTDGNTLKQAKSSAQLMGKVVGQVIGSDE